MHQNTLTHSHTQIHSQTDRHTQVTFRFICISDRMSSFSILSRSFHLSLSLFLSPSLIAVSDFGATLVSLQDTICVYACVFERKRCKPHLASPLFAFEGEGECFQCPGNKVVEQRCAGAGGIVDPRVAMKMRPIFSFF